MNPQYLKQYKDTPFYLNHEGEIYRKYKCGYKKINGCKEEKNGYKRIRIHIGNKKYHLSRMMWETFMGEVPEGYCVVHKNGCSMMNDIGNLKLIRINDYNTYRKTCCKVQKIINLSTGRVYKGTRAAASDLKHSRRSIILACSGIKMEHLKINVAWWDDVNDKAFKGDYHTYHDKYMQEEW